MSAVLGLLLAAGAGRRMGTPKALLRDEHGEPFLRRSVAVLREGGCQDVLVVLGAGSDRAADLLDEGVAVVVAEDWAEGMGASFRAGLAAAERTEATCALVSLVDLPDVGAAVVRRVVEQGGTTGQAVLARAAYDGAPGHPVLIGRDHWAGVSATARGDRGARDYLADHPPTLVECGDLATGRDVDTPEHLRQELRRR
jgi:CTP:molybdopterin cytidylyltransferase MocA